MKKLVQTAANFLLSLMLVVGLANEAFAAGRLDSKEPVSSASDSTLIFVIVAIMAVVIVVALTIVVAKRKKQTEDKQIEPIIIRPPSAPAARHKATLEAQGTFLGGKHYGIVTHATIGRSSRADIRVNDPKVSGIHCQVSMENGKLVLMDMDSTNGTSVGGNGKVVPKTKVLLSSGSVFWLGDERNSFRVVIK